MNGSVVRIYQIGLGLNPVPDKIRQGDRATPEGEFYVFTKNNKSAFYLSSELVIQTLKTLNEACAIA
ncbi:MAG TPA: hypothetical protein VEW46_18010 [Pyrinomonadaceae bacterium]|nr:hypothetical protein [Pyrinomonadaceae bacterium]